MGWPTPIPHYGGVILEVTFAGYSSDVRPDALTVIALCLERYAQTKPPILLLQPVAERRAVLLLEHLPADVHRIIGADAEDVRVVGGVVDLAERQTVLDDRLAAIIRVGDDVRRIKELDVRQPADSAPARVGVDDDIAEGTLVEPMPGLGPRVAPQVQG